MGVKINIVEILKDKPLGTKLWTDMFGEVTLSDVDREFDVFQVKHHGRETSFNKDGSICKEGTLCIYPSKLMRDWSKFAWKKGDVLVSRGGTVEVIFDGFDDDDYVNFKGKHALKTIEGESEYNGDSDDGYDFYTENYHLESEDAAQTYINTIEGRLGGNLNRETLEIEKPEFKDGDIITIRPILEDEFIFLFKSEDKENYYGHAFLDENIAIIDEDSNYQKDFCNTARLSTEEEKQQLFDALAKEGKAWDAEKKQIVNLKPKWTPKPFDRVITRNAADDVWTANIFSHIDSHGEYVTIACVGGYTHCLPYNEETAKLIGTTKNVED